MNDLDKNMMEMLGMNANPSAWKEHDKLSAMIASGEGIDPGSEVEKLHEYLKASDTMSFHISLAPDFNGTAEVLARSINQTFDQINDPIEGSVSRAKGHLFEKKDYVSCLEKRMSIDSGKPMSVELTDQEQKTIRSYKEDIQVIEDLIAVINLLTEDQVDLQY